MKVAFRYCTICDCRAVWVEEPVPDLESATVWHCRYCGTEEKPTDDTDRGILEVPPPLKPRPKDGVELQIPQETNG